MKMKVDMKAFCNATSVFVLMNTIKYIYIHNMFYFLYLACILNKTRVDKKCY